MCLWEYISLIHFWKREKHMHMKEMDGTLVMHIPAGGVGASWRDQDREEGRRKP